MMLSIITLASFRYEPVGYVSLDVTNASKLTYYTGSGAAEMLP